MLSLMELVALFVITTLAGNAFQTALLDFMETHADLAPHFVNHALILLFTLVFHVMR